MIIKPSSRRDAFAKMPKGSLQKKGLSTGFSCLDEYLRLAKGYLAIITGVPGSGKSEWLDAVLINMALSNGWKTTYFSPENYPIECHMSKLAEKYIGKHITEFSAKDIDVSLEFLDNHFTWLYPEEPELNTLVACALKVKEEGGLDCFVIDPWNAVMHKRNNSMIHEYLAEALAKLIKFSRTQDALMAVIAHPTKPQKDKDGNYAPLNLYDISDGAMWRNRCDYGVVVNRPDSSQHYIELNVQKIKQKFLGRLGGVRLDYDYRTGRFKCVDETSFQLPTEIRNPF